MFGKIDVGIIPRQNQGVATIRNADVECFFKIIDIRVMLPVKKGQEGQVVKFECCGAYGWLLCL